MSLRLRSGHYALSVPVPYRILLVHAEYTHILP